MGFEIRSGCCDENTTQLIGLFVDDRSVAAFLQCQSCFHAAYTAADDSDLFLYGCFLNKETFGLHRFRIQGTAAHMHGIIHGLGVVGAVGSGHRQTGTLTGDAGLDVFFPVFDDFFKPGRIGQELPSDPDRIDVAVLNRFGSGI